MSNEDNITALVATHPLKRFWQDKHLDLVVHFDEENGKLDRLDINQNDVPLCIYRLSKNIPDTVEKYIIPDGEHSITDIEPSPSDEEHLAYTLFIENLFKKQHPYMKRGSFKTIFSKFPEFI